MYLLLSLHDASDEQSTGTCLMEMPNEARKYTGNVIFFDILKHTYTRISTLAHNLLKQTVISFPTDE